MVVYIKTFLLVAIGFLFLAIGAIGLVLPVLPTTPFVIISAACFSATPRLKSQIMKIKFFNEHINNYEDRTGLSKKTVTISLVYLWGMMTLSIILVENISISLLLLFIGVAVTVHILWVSKAKK